MKAYQIVQKARDIKRISTSDVIGALCGDDFIECRPAHDHHWYSKGQDHQGKHQA